jgi:hypothetical protein
MRDRLKREVSTGMDRKEEITKILHIGAGPQSLVILGGQGIFVLKRESSPLGFERVFNCLLMKRRTKTHKDTDNFLVTVCMSIN